MAGKRDAKGSIGWGKLIAGAVGVAAAGAAWLYWREKSVETPPHESERIDGAFEIRAYPALLVAETDQRGTRDRALGNGLGLLADYVFAEARGAGDAGKELALTAPLMAAAAAKGWTIRVMLPSGITRETAPVPGEGVRIAELPARRVALMRFSGRVDDALLAAKEAELRAWMAQQELKPKGRVEHGFYDSPLMPGPLRSNELMFEIR